MTPYETYMQIVKEAGAAERLVGAGVGSLAGMAAGAISPTPKRDEGGHFTLHRTPEEFKRDIGMGAVLGMAIGAGAAPFFKQANPVGMLLGQPDAPKYDPETHAAIMAAKSRFNRSRLVYQQTFRKLEPTAQKEILKAYDDYTSTIDGAIRAGKYPRGGY